MMTAVLNRFFSAQSRFGISAISCALVAFVGQIDYLTGYELAFSIFYVIPVGISAWYSGKRHGTAICILAAMTWLVADLTSGREYTHLAFPFWNASVRFGFFLIVAYLLWRLRDALAFQSSLAQNDGLTGIPNARVFRERCSFVIQIATRHRHPVTLGYIDLDGFKRINDTLGHGVGDQVLKAVASELVARLRESDVVARLGGDEFSVLLPETEFSGAKAIFSEIREGLVRLAERNQWRLGFSIGVAVFRRAPANLDDALKSADELMYKAKRAGNSTLVIEEHSDEPLNAA